MKIAAAVLVLALLTVGCAGSGKLVDVGIFASQAQELGAAKLEFQQVEAANKQFQKAVQQFQARETALRAIFARGQYVAMQADSTDVEALRKYGLRMFAPVPAPVAEAPKEDAK